MNSCPITSTERFAGKTFGETTNINNIIVYPLTNLFSVYRVGGSLGSGEFGVVNRGRWQDTIIGVSLEVAIKTLRPTATEMDKVKFLQEAAINGQFKHPNIVQLYGVVTVGEPVCL